MLQQNKITLKNEDGRMFAEFFKKLKKSLKVFLCNLANNALDAEAIRYLVEGTQTCPIIHFLHLNLTGNPANLEDVAPVIARFQRQHQEKDFFL